MATTARTPRRVLPVGPLLLIGLGAVLLLNNLGLLSWEIWPALLRFWPLALVLLGLQALVSGRVDWASLMLLLLAVALVSIGTQFAAWTPREQRALGSPATDAFQQPLQGARSARLEVEFGAGELRLDGGVTPGLLASGSLNAEGEGRLRTAYRLRDGVGQLEVEAAGGGSGGFPFWRGMDQASSQLVLNVTREVPIELDVKVGAANATLDLRELQVSSLRYDTGASQSRVVLPASGSTRAEIRGGATSVTIEIPAGVAARIQTTGSGLSEVSVDQSRFPRTGDVYQSVDYGTAQNRVDLRLQVGVANVVVR